MFSLSSNMFYDFPVGVGAFFFLGIPGILFFILVTIPIVMLEALALFKFGYGSPKRVLAISTLMNVTSGLIGYIAGYFITTNIWESLFLPVVNLFYSPAPTAFLFLFISFAISVISEALVVKWMVRVQSIKSILYTVLVANCLSYLLLFILYGTVAYFEIDVYPFL